MYIVKLLMNSILNHPSIHITLHRALDGKPAQLKALFGSTGRWEGIPLADGKSGDIQEAIDIIDQGRSFMIDPRLTVTGSQINRASNKVNSCVHKPWLTFDLASDVSKSIHR